MTNDTVRDVIAIDFDGCLCENAYPNIGAPHHDVICNAIQRRRNGSKLILWTCRTGDMLAQALTFCDVWGLHFDAVNENLPEAIERYGNDSRKVFATEYWDDKAFRVGNMVYDAEDSCYVHESGDVQMTNVDRHAALCVELSTLYERKNADYGDSFHETFAEEGMAVLRIRLTDKLNRLKRLTRGNEAQMKTESIRDTLIDLANYAIMGVMEIDAEGDAGNGT